MELKKHTKEELKKMSEEEFCDYKEKLFDLANDIGLKRCCMEELETSLLNIKELAGNKKKKRGHNYSFLSSPKHELDAIRKIDKGLEKCKNLIIEQLESYIGCGLLVLTRALCYKDALGFKTKIKYIYNERFYSVWDECEYEEKLCCAESPGDENSINLHTLPLEFLIKIYQKITDFNEARLWTDEEVIADNINPEEIKI